MSAWRRALLIGVVLLVAALPMAPVSGQSGSESGQAAVLPWTGWWWPWIDWRNPNHYDAGEDSGKYDLYVQNTRGANPQTLPWERANHWVPPESDLDWWGECHAWAACSILEPEPPLSLRVGGVDFSQRNLKALLTEQYYNPTYIVWGSRFVEGGSQSAYDDIYPVDFDRLVRLYLGQQRQALIMDRDPNVQVWNFPAYAYQRSSTVDNGVESVTMTVTFANVASNASGTVLVTRTYTYTLNDGTTTGTWTGASVNDHPDFVWLPTGHAAPESPQAGAIVEEILSGQAVDIARGRPTTASSVEAPSYPPANATDGNASTRWSSAYSDPQWLQVDLGQSRDLTSAVIRWEYAYAQSWELQLSDDGQAWRTVYSQPASTGGTEIVSFSGQGRYVRLSMTRRATSFGNSIWSFEIYARQGPSFPTPTPIPSPTPVRPNLALGKVATATSSENPTLGLEKAVDGDRSSRWSSAWSDDQAITVDLGQSHAIDTVVLRWESAYGRDYTIDLSPDGASWTTVFTRTNGSGGVETLTVNGTGRFVRMHGMRRGTSFGYSLYEIEVYGSNAAATPTPTLTATPTAADNLALGRPASASSQESPALGPERAVDGNATSRWSSQFSDPQWLQVDLGAVRSVRRVVLRWETAYGRNYQIQVSSDGANWSTVASRQNWAGGTDSLSFAPTSARFVRVYGTARGTSWGYSLYEFEVY